MSLQAVATHFQRILRLTSRDTQLVEKLHAKVMDKDIMKYAEKLHIFKVLIVFGTALTKNSKQNL